MTAGGAGGGAAVCPAETPAAPTSAGRLNVPLGVTVTGSKLVIGEAARTRAGSEYRVTLFKYFLSQPTLIAVGGAEVATELLTMDGLLAPYGLLLVDAEDDTQVLSLAAPAGAYEGLRFSIGVPAPCNGWDPTLHAFPLNAGSDMYWTWGEQFMFIRLEGAERPSSADAWSTLRHHVGFEPAFVTLTLPAALTVTEGTSTAGVMLSLDVDRLLEPRDGTKPAGQHAVVEGWIVDNIEDNQVFTLK